MNKVIFRFTLALGLAVVGMGVLLGVLGDGWESVHASPNESAPGLESSEALGVDPARSDARPSPEWGQSAAGHPPLRPLDGPLGTASVVTVCQLSAGACPYTSVQAAVGAASVGALIKVAEGTYTDTNGDGYVVHVTKTVTIQGGYTTTNWTTSKPDVYPTYLDGENAGGVVYINAGIDPVLEGFHIHNGSASSGGGLYVATAGSSVVRRNRIYSNSATSNGGAVYIAGGSPVLENNLVYGNLAERGGGFYLNSGSPVAWQNSLHGNSASADGGGIYFRGTPTILSSIIVSNTASNGGGIFRGEGSYRPQYNDVWGNSGGNYGGFGATTPPNNLSADPRFVDPAGADFRLGDGSPCIDAADPDDYSEEDYDGYARPLGTRPDMGAHEYYPGTCFARVGDSQVYTSVQAAVDASAAGDVVKVVGLCQGVETKSNRQQTVYIDRALTLRGGYTLTNWNEADWDTHRTVLDPQGQGRGILIWQRVATVEGFDVRNGIGSAGGGIDAHGGGIYVNDGGASVIRNNRVYSNSCTDRGGGIYIYDADEGDDALPTIQDNVIYSNTTTGEANVYGGGGIYVEGDVIVDGNLVYSNRARFGSGIYLKGGTDRTEIRNNRIYANASIDTIEGQGGGIYVYNNATTGRIWNNDVYSNVTVKRGGGIYVGGASPVVEENRLYGNQVTNNIDNNGGGGIYLDECANASQVRNNQIYGNVVEGWGGGVSIVAGYGCSGNERILEGNEFYDNSSGKDGGGVYIRFLSPNTATIRNNLIYSNTAGTGGTGGGGGLAIDLDNSSPNPHTTVENNTIYTNTASSGGGIYREDNGGSIAIRNNIIVDNSVDGVHGPVTVTYCDVSGNTPSDYNSGSGASAGTGSISADPSFVDAAGWDFHLQDGSPCLDAADPDYYAEYDYDGRARFFGPRADIGAHEFYTGTCFARLSTGGRVYTTVQAAIYTATLSGAPMPEVRAAGYCEGPSGMVAISQSLSLLGGYTLTNWLTPTALTTLDAWEQGRVIYVTGTTTGTVTIGELVLRGGWDDTGGGVQVETPMTTTIRNVVFYDNGVSRIGGGLRTIDSTVYLYNTTFVSNEANNGGGGMYLTGGYAVVSNSIVVSNTGGGIYADGTATVLDYNDVWHNTAGSDYSSTVSPGPHDVSFDPRFEADGYHLRIDSPLLHAGDPHTALPWDVEGDSRTRDRGPDIGADERAIYPDLLFAPKLLESMRGVPGEDLVHTHYLTNTGTITEQFDLSHRLTYTGSGGWGVSYPLSLALVAGEVAAVPVTLSVPAEAVSGTTAVVVLTATASLNPTVYDVVTNTTFVEWNPGVRITPVYSENVNPGTVITYVHVVSNTGNAPDSFDLTFSSARGWATITPTHVGDLAAHTGRTVLVAVAVPAWMPGGLVETTILTATSPYSDVSDTIVDRTQVNYTPGDRFVAQTAESTDDLNNCHVITKPCASIVYAVGQATNGDAIKVAEGTYSEHDIILNKRVILRGGYIPVSDEEWESWPRTYPTVVDAQGLGRVFYIFGSPTLEGLTIQGGATDGAGGGVYVGLGQPVIQRNRITGNSALRGGGLASSYYGRPKLWNTFVYGNTANDYGGGVYLGGGGQVWHDTLYDNTAYRGGGVYLAAASPEIQNSIVVSNSAYEGGGLYQGSGSPVLDYNDVWHNPGGDYGGGLTAGAHSTSTNPLLVDPVSGDLHLQEDSACISIAGASALEDDFDDREQRPMGAGPDMGADEFLEPWVQLEPDRTGSEVSGLVFTYTHTVTNIGARTDTFTFTASSAHGWVITPSRPVTLTSGEGTSVTCQIYIPEEAISGTVDVAVITATSLYNPVVFDTALETTTVGLTHTVLITPDRWAMIDSDPNNKILVTFTHQLTNTGNYTATFDLMGGGGDPGFPTVVEPPSATLGVQDGIMVSVAITVTEIPTHVFMADTEIISAVSWLDPTVYDRARDTILINIRPGVEITPDGELTGLPDETLFYPHVMTNTGNYTDTFSFTAESRLGWAVVAPPTTTLASGVRKTVNVTVPIPSFVLSGTMDVTTVTVSSGWLPTVTASVVDTTTVGRDIAVDVQGTLPEQADGWCVPPDYTGPVPYGFSVSNAGNYTDTFDITAISIEGVMMTVTVLWDGAAPVRGMAVECESGSCPATLSPSMVEGIEEMFPTAPDAVMYAEQTFSVTLGPTGTVDLLIEVLMDPTRTEYYTDTVIVTAVSQADPNVSASDSFISEINTDAFADIEPNNEDTIFLEKVITYTHIVTYTGTVPDNNIAVSAESSEGWTVVVTPTSIAMSQNDTAQVWVRLEVPLDAIDVVDITTVRTETTDECISWDTAVNTTTVRRPHVILVPDHDEIVIPGRTVRFQHTLINDGVYTDSYDLGTTLVYSSGVGWARSVVPTEVVDLPPGGSVPVTATVIVPSGLISGTKATLTVTAVARGYTATISADAIDEMTVPYLPDAAFSLGRSGQLGPDGTAHTEPGGVVTYTHSLTNTGNYTLSFDLTTHPKFSNAEIVAPPSEVVSELGMGEVYTPVVVRIEIPDHAAAGEVEETEVIAAFDAGQAVAVDYTTVDPITGTRYVAPDGRDDNNNCRRPQGYGPCATVQHAVDVAQAGDEILVADGLYDAVEATVAGGETYTQVVYLDKDVTLLGGYDTTRWEAFDPIVNRSVLDAGGRGRVIYVADRVTATIAGFYVRNGQVVGDGAGLYVASTSLVTVTDNTFHDNQATGSGGGLFYGGGDSPVERNTFHDNEATNGAGLYLAAGSPTVWNSLFYSNTASYGGGLYVADGDLTAWHNTFYSNTASQGGGGVYIGDSSVSISNTILVQNTGYGVYRGSSVATATWDYNDVWENPDGNYGDSGGSLTGGVNDHAVDPLFVAPAVGNLQLTKNSPCIDIGDPNTTVGEDRDGSDRPLLNGYDVGAYEYGLGFGKRVTPTASVPPGGIITYTIVVTNYGTGNTTVSITDTLHPFLSCEGGQVVGNEAWVGSSGGYQSSPCRLAWDGRVEARSTALVSFTAYITDWLAAGTIITNYGWVNSDATNWVTTTVASTPGPRYVTMDGDDADYNGCLSPRHPCRTVQRAVDQAWDDDPVYVALGVYTDTGTVVSITKSLTLTGGYTPTQPLWTCDPEAYTTTLDGQSSATVVAIVGSGAETVTLTGFHIQNGADGVAADGAALDITHSWIHDHTGDGLRVTDGALALTRAWVYGNGGNGVDLSGSLFRLDNVILSDNSGGGVQADSASEGSVRHNTLVNNGPFGASVAGTAHLTNTIVCSQTVGVDGTGGAVSVFDTLWYGNESKTSGGVSIGGADLEADPVFVDPAGMDYHIAPGSGALDAGSDAGLAEDIDADARPMGQGYDLGADELRISVDVSKQVAPDPVDAGGVVRYTIRVTNTGIYTLHTTIVDELPDQLTTVETTTWTSVLGPDDVWSGAFNANVAWGYSGTLTNRVRVTSTEGAVDVFTATSRSQVMPGLTVAKWGGPAVVEAGERLTYTIRLTNTGNLDLHATITDTLPAQVSPSDPLTWTAVITAPDGIWETSYPVTVAWGYSGTLVNQVQVTTAEGSAGSAVQVSQAWVTPAVAVVKWPDPDPVRDGEPVTYTIRVTNTGNVGLSATITDILPACVTTADPLTWTADLLTDDSVWEGSFTGMVEEGCSGPVVNEVWVTTAEGASDVYTHTSLIGCPSPLEGVDISGPSEGYTGTLYAFDADVAPTDATPPITYTWQAMGQDEVVTTTSRVTHTASFSWTVAGPKIITVTAENCGGSQVTTHTITIQALPQDCPHPLTDVGIGGPTDGYTDTLYAFTAVVTPTDATPPITYTWQAMGQDEVVTTTLASTHGVSFTWTVSGTKIITVTAENCGGRQVTTHTITIQGTPPDCPSPLSGVRISGPLEGHVNTDLTFTAIPDPLNATPFITYTWSPEPVSGQGTEVAVYRWITPDTYIIAVTAENCGWWPVSDIHSVIVAKFRIYLPLVLRNY